MGGDFNYQDAQVYYKNMDKLIRYTNARQSDGSDVNVFYSTPACYLKSLHESNLTWTTKQDDFFPYASDEHSYWTGYFTSRPSLKLFERQSNNALQMGKQLASLALLSSDDSANLDKLREVMGVMQHHDAVAGTEKQHVADDYARQLTDALRQTGRVSGAAMGKLMDLNTGTAPPALALRSCPLVNISQCDVSQNNANFVVTLYNPLSRVMDHNVIIPVPADNAYSVKSADGTEILAQVNQVFDGILALPGRTGTTDGELLFTATGIPPLGYTSYYVSQVAKKEGQKATKTAFKKLNKPFSLKGKDVEVKFNDKGLMTSVTRAGKEVSLQFDFGFYKGFLGDNGAADRRSSGAYIFRPDGEFSSFDAEDVETTIYEGPVMSRVVQTCNSMLTHTINVYNVAEAVEIGFIIPEINIDDGNGRELTMRYDTDIFNDKVFKTDSNGRENIQRIRDHRDTWELDPHEPVAGNYYPIATNIELSDETGTLYVVTDRSQGGSSLKQGQIEVMLHRRLLHDDAFGVGEALNETAYGKGLAFVGAHWFMTGDTNDATFPLRKALLRQEKVLQTYMLLGETQGQDFDTWAKNYRLQFSGLVNPLPDVVQVLTLEPWGENEVLLRFEHLLEKGDGGEPVTVSLDNLFTTFDIVEAKETTLGANSWLGDVTRLQWRKESNSVSEDKPFVSTKALPEVELPPRGIRTFVCKIKAK